MAFFRTLALILPLFIVMPASAQSIVPGNPASSGAQTLTEEQASALEELIEKLESESGRKELIDQLKALLDASRKGEAAAGNQDSIQDENEGLAESVTDSLGIDALSEEVMSQYKSWIQELGVRQNTPIQIAVLTALVIGWGILALIAAALIRKVSSGRAVERWKRVSSPNRISRYFSAARWLIQGALTVGVIYLAAATLGYSLENGEFGKRLGDTANTVFGILLVLVVALAIYELIVFALARLARRDSNRLQTVIPLLRNIVVVTMSVVVGLVVLSEFGIDIMPLLAGAGVVGIAIGFGAQALVKDLLSGILIIIEDLFQVGDWVALGDSEGTVENITFRKVDLRDLSGAVHTIPFGTIETVRNMTKDYSYAVLETGVAYREDTDAVTEEIIAVAEELRKDDTFGPLIQGDLEVMGVNDLGDSAVVIKTRTRTIAGRQWAVAREMRRRIKYRFDECGIEIPFPHQTIYFGEPKSGSAPPANISLLDRSEKSRQAQGDGGQAASSGGSDEEMTSTGRLGDSAED